MNDIPEMEIIPPDLRYAPKLSAALVAASAEMPVVPFDAKNPFLGNQFASLGAVIAIARPILAKHGLAIMQFACSNSSGQVGVRTRLIHSSGEYLEETIYLDATEEKGKSRAQVAGSIITYLRRYSQSALLNLYADEDTDGNAPPLTGASAAVPAHPEAKRASTPQTPPKTAAAVPGAQGGAKGSAPPNPEKCKARFLEIVREKKWEPFTWKLFVDQGYILATEKMDDADPKFFPLTKDESEALLVGIKSVMDTYAKGGISQELAEAYDKAYLDIEEPENLAGPGPMQEDWMGVEIHFGTRKGVKLKDLDRKTLFGWCKQWEPKPYKGRIADKDKALRKALDDALSWLDEHKEPRKEVQTYQAPTDDNVPF